VFTVLDNTLKDDWSFGQTDRQTDHT